MSSKIRRIWTRLFARHDEIRRDQASNRADRKRQTRRRARRDRHKSRPTAFDWLAYAHRAQSLRLLRQNRVLVDTRITTCDGFAERVHWQVLDALCPKLMRASATSAEHEDCRPDGCRQLRLPDHIDGSIALLLIECAYGEPKLSLCRSNLERFYEIAIEYDIMHALNICLDHARTILDVNNCIYLYLLSLKHKHHKLRRASYSMIRANFKLILHVNKDFHSLQANHLKQLLLDNKLKLNDDEEIAWLAIVRWRRGRCLGPRELTNLYNQMVGAHQDVQLIQWPGPASQTSRVLPSPSEVAGSRAEGSQLVASGQPTGGAGNNFAPANRIPLRLALDFYSPADPIESAAHSRTGHAKHKTGLSCSPLRRPAERLLRADERRPRRDDELELCSLVKCLRFARFKSLAAFDTIESSEFVASSALLTELVKHMRVAYKLKHNLALGDEEKQAVGHERLRRLKAHYKSRSERLVSALMRVAKLRPTATGDENQAGRLLENTLANRDANCKPGPDPEAGLLAVDQLIGQRTLQRADRPRVPVSVGLLIGGWQDGRVSRSIWAYDFVSDRWFKLNIRLPEARAFHASCSSPSRGHIYIFGGTNGHSILDSVLKLNLASDVYIGPKQRGTDKLAAAGRETHGHASSELGLIYKFKSLRPMNERRCHLSGVLHSDGRVYALGGHNGTQRLRSGEWYDPMSNQWHPIAEMTIARADAAACSHENKIFIAGGQISDQFIQSSVEFYKSSDNTWTFAAPMIIPRMSFRMVSYKGQMLAIGGTNGSSNAEELASVTRTVERYNQSSGSWSFCAPMLTKRCSFGALQIGNKLLVMGGHGGRRRLKSCESLRIGHFSGHSMGSLLAMAHFIQDRLQPPTGANEPRARDRPATSFKLTADQFNAARQADATATAATESNGASLHGLVSGAPQSATHQLLSSVARLGSQPHTRSAMKWVTRNRLPERRSGFSVVAVHKLRNAEDFTFYGSLKPPPRVSQRRQFGSMSLTAKRPSYIKRPGRWSRFKVIKRRKLMKRLKIALIVTAVILMMW